MSYRSLAIILIAIILLGEAGLALWRHLPIEPSTAPAPAHAPAQVFDFCQN